MSAWKKLLAAPAGGSGLDVDAVFNTSLYKGTASAKTITNGIDLDGEGGLVWIKNRDEAYNNVFTDTERGVRKTLVSNLNSAQQTESSTEGLTAFNSNGFTLGSGDANFNPYNKDCVSWTFRKAPKFFDIVTYTGNGTAGRTVAHNLGSVPGCIMVKGLEGDNWHVYHRGNNNGTNPEDYYLKLNATSVKQSNIPAWNDTAPTDSVFSLGDDGGVNGNNATYVAYLFAHNDGDGEFGPKGDQDIIKCDKYLGGGASLVDIDCGFEPSWVMIKGSNEVSDWVILDSMRGVASVGSGSKYLEANTTKAENAGATYIYFTPTGFQTQTNNNDTNASGGQYTYIAIRRGSLFPPEAATDVFGMYQISGYNTLPTFLSPNGPDPANETLPIDFAFYKYTTGTEDWWTGARLISGKALRLNTLDSEITSNAQTFDFMNGWGTSQIGSSTPYRSWMWKRAPGYFDFVTYLGNGTAGRTVSHNLGVVPEMMWVKKSSSGSSRNWYVYHSGNYDQGSGSGAAHGYVVLNTSDAFEDQNFSWNDTAPTKSVFSLGSFATNDNNSPYVAVLFATTAGVSKVGRYTGNGSSQTIDCGFSSGARFILIKRANAAGDWYLWDTKSGIVSGNDYHLSPNTGAGQVLDDSVDPASSGFAVNQISATNINVSSSVYIFYAIA